MKKLISILLTFAMIMTCGFGVVGATDLESANCIETLTALDIFRGYENGELNLDDNITRAEFSAIVCRTLDYGTTNGASKFSDLAGHWGAGYVNTLAGTEINGAAIINGMGDGTFAPDASVTVEQAVKMIVVALGYEPMAAERGGFPAGYMAVARSKGLLDDVDVNNQEAPATRGIVAQIVYNALDVDLMEQTGYGTDKKYEAVENKTLLTELDIAKLEGNVIETSKGGNIEKGEVVYSFNDANDDKYWTKYLENNAQDGYAQVTLDFADDVDADEYFGIASVIYVKETKGKYEIVAIMPNEDAEIVNVALEDIDEDTTDAEIIYYSSTSSSKTSKYKMASTYPIIYNYAITDKTLTDIIFYDDVIDMEITLIENNGDNRYDMVVIKEYTYDVVDSIDVESDEFESKNGETFAFDFEDDELQIEMTDVYGDVITLADFAEDDVIAYISDEGDADFTNWIEIINLGSNIVKGNVEEKKNDAIYVGGTKYLLACDEIIKAGDEGIFYLTRTDKVFKVDKSASVSKNYAYVIQAKFVNTGFDDAWQIELLTKEGEVVVYDFREDFTIDGDDYENDVSDNNVFYDDVNDENVFVKSEWKNDIASRIVTFKVDSKNAIKELNFIGSEDDFTDAEYRADAQLIKTVGDITDDVIVFGLTGSTVTSAFITGLSYLVDENKYSGEYVVDEDGEVAALFITEGASIIDVTQDIAIIAEATDITVNEGSDDAIKIRYYVSEDTEMKEIIVVKDADVTTLEWDTAYADIKEGSLFMFTDDGNGTASAIGVIATVTNNAYVVNSTATAAIIDTDEDNAFDAGYIVNWESKSAGMKVNVEATEDYYTIKGSANAYTYEIRNSKIIINVGNWKDADVEKATTDYANFFFVRTYNDTVVDFFTISPAAELQ